MHVADTSGVHEKDPSPTATTSVLPASLKVDDAGLEAGESDKEKNGLSESMSVSAHGQKFDLLKSRQRVVHTTTCKLRKPTPTRQCDAHARHISDRPPKRIRRAACTEPHNCSQRSSSGGKRRRDVACRTSKQDSGAFNRWDLPQIR